ncbi:MAG: hypothetical protein J0L91_01605 [Burkholderiales bacterium]|nr:hypothetical protein [Burkholderiales bacterium]MCC7114582.1 hypothetical protein [Burkholderiales bacterium]
MSIRNRVVTVTAVFALVSVLAAPATAALHHWALSGVTFDDGAGARGVFTYDDVTQTVVSWNISVDAGVSYLPFTYMPGDSGVVTTVDAAGTQILFSSAAAGLPLNERQLRLTATLPLSAGTSPNPLNLATPDGGSGGVECYNCGAPRLIVAGALVVSPPPLGELVQAVEFYHSGLDHYFLTADANEILVLDTGVLPGWARTGQAFSAFAPGSPNDVPIRPVCRFYGLPSAGLASHFYSADPAECLRVFDLFPSSWQVEAGNVFQVALPDTSTGACATGSQPVYRVFNNRTDVNHRYMTSLAIRAQMEAAGWVREGYGPEATIMCAVAPSP